MPLCGSYFGSIKPNMKWNMIFERTLKNPSTSYMLSTQDGYISYSAAEAPSSFVGECRLPGLFEATAAASTVVAVKASQGLGVTRSVALSLSLSVPLSLPFFPDFLTV